MDDNISQELEMTFDCLRQKEARRKGCPHTGCGRRVGFRAVRFDDDPGARQRSGPSRVALRPTHFLLPNFRLFERKLADLTNRR